MHVRTAHRRSRWRSSAVGIPALRSQIGRAVARHRGRPAARTAAGRTCRPQPRDFGGLPGDGFEAVQYYGLAAPAGTPRIVRLNKELRGILATDDMKKRLLENGSDPVSGPPEDYAANILHEEGKWAALIKKLGLKVE